MKTIDTVIFDLDGTLLNTLGDIADSANHALSLFGYPARSIDEIRSFVGNGLGHLMELCLPGGENNPHYDECIADFRSHYYSNMQNKTAPYDGIIDLLKQLSQNNFKMAVVSNKFDQAVKKLTHDYFGTYVNVAIGDSKNIARKPAPDTVFKALEELGSSADKAVYLGDSEVDIETARNSGLTSVGAAWGFKGRMFLEANGADYIIDQPRELLKLIVFL
ncbi:MAG: superfamily hydrolase [Firmicutes bacterium]|nr:superfamily hydrolase [Bacillota bacterium]